MTADAAPNVADEIALFRHLPPEHLEQLTRHFHRKTVEAGTHLMLAEQPAESAYLIVSGTVKVHLEQPDGSDVLLAILGPGDLVGEMSVIEGKGRSASAVTLEEVAYYWVARSAFRACLQTMPALAWNLSAILSRRLRLANARIAALSHLDVAGRVAQQLLALADEYGIEAAEGGGTYIPIRLTQTDLGSLVGATRVRVNQVLATYRRRGYLSIDAHAHITVANSQALAKLCDGY